MDSDRTGIDTTIDAPMAHFRQLSPDAEVGPHNRVDPNPRFDLAEKTARWLELHPFLKRDTAYVAFLERYSGTGITDDRQHLLVDILGFLGVGSALDERDLDFFDDSVPAIDPDGFYQIAFASHCVTWPYDRVARYFFFDATGGGRRWGIYALTCADGGPKNKPVWCCETNSID